MAAPLDQALLAAGATLLALAGVGAVLDAWWRPTNDRRVHDALLRDYLARVPSWQALGPVRVTLRLEGMVREVDGALVVVGPEPDGHLTQVVPAGTIEVLRASEGTFQARLARPIHWDRVTGLARWMRVTEPVLGYRSDGDSVGAFIDPPTWDLTGLGAVAVQGTIAVMPSGNFRQGAVTEREVDRCS